MELTTILELPPDGNVWIASQVVLLPPPTRELTPQHRQNEGLTRVIRLPSVSRHIFPMGFDHICGFLFSSIDMI